MGKLTIVGAGVAGSYLANRLEHKGLDFTIYERNPKTRGHRCAWGCFVSLLTDKIRETGLKVDDYVLCRTSILSVNGVEIPLINEVSIDKPKLIKDLYPDEKLEKRNFDLNHYPNNGWVVNATAIPLCDYYQISTKQYKAKIRNLEPNTAYVNIDFNYNGYGWIFPLDEDTRTFHLGAGCVNGDPEVLVNLVIKAYGADVTDICCACERPIAVTDPSSTVLSRNNVVSVGESAGCVYPISGEGIIPSMDTVDLLVESIMSDRFPELYLSEMMKKKLREYNKPFRVWRLMNRNAKLAWLVGAPYLFNRSRKRTMAILDLKTILHLLWKFCNQKY